MRAIKITKRFPGIKRTYDAGVYLVPEEMGKAEARMAAIDFYGHEAGEGDQAEVDRLVQDFRKRAAGDRKGPALEDKQRGAAPENKREVDGSPVGGDSGIGPKPGGARSLTAGTAVQRPASRGK